MNGFKDRAFNRDLAGAMLEKLLKKILQCSQRMVDDYKRLGKTIKNREEHIRNVLYSNYLNDTRIVSEIGLNKYHFEAEVPENYQNHKPIGRVDLKVITAATFSQKDAYIVIECKRLDGSRNLNRAYVNEGINRYIDEAETKAKYSSYYGMSCMFGMVVEQIDIEENMREISKIEREKYKSKLNISGINKHTFSENHPHTYLSNYHRNSQKLRIYHVIHDFSSIVS